MLGIEILVKRKKAFYFFYDHCGALGGSNYDLALAGLISNSLGFG